VLILVPAPVIPGAVVRARPIGLLQMADEKGNDEKIVCVPHDRVHPQYSHIDSIEHLPEITRRVIENFFARYKELEEDKWVKVSGWQPRAAAEAAIRKAIAKGVQDGHFGYASGPKPAPGPDGKFQVALSKVRFKTPVTDDEIDLESGFLMLPQAIPQSASATGAEPTLVAPGQETPPTVGTGGGTTVLPDVTVPSQTATPPMPATDKALELTFTADRNGLFTAWNAIANLADMAGQVQVTIRATSEKGFDKSKLQNGVLEPLREANLIE